MVIGVIRQMYCCGAGQLERATVALLPAAAGVRRFGAFLKTIFRNVYSPLPI